MKRTVLFCLLLGASLSLFAQDYSVGRQLNDIGTNGFNTNYVINASSPDVVINDVGIPLTGSILNGNTIVVPFSYVFHQTASGAYQITVTLSCDGCGEPDVNLSFNLVVQETPEVTIEAFPDIYLCNGEMGTLTASVSNSTGNEIYSWSTGANGDSTNVSTSGTYTVTVTNACGSTIESIDIKAGVEPVISNQTCVNTGNTLTTVVTASDPTGEGLSFQWLEDGVPISSGGDFVITPLSATESQLVVNNIASSAYNLSIFTCEVSTTCGATNSFGCLAVPVEFLYFRGGATEEGILLEWATATETDNEGFMVERSFDGGEFKEMGQIQGAGNSQSELNYSFLDRAPLRENYVGPVYYRLKQMDFDGAFEYSTVISLDIHPAAPLSIDHAGTFAGALHVSFNQAYQSQLEIRLLTINGDQIISEKGMWSAGQHEWVLPVHSVVAGIYLVQINNGAQTVTQRLVHF
ncbi:MAG: T9SS type A sorting domain-containing protein [Bacteroidota bacterium]